MNQKVLFEFLRSKVICDGEIFPSEVGISLGNTLFPLIGNLVLDGLQKELYEVQRKCTLLLPKNAKLELITLQKYIWKKYGITKGWKGGGCMDI